jgi:uncharacterized protein YycO
VQFKTDNPQVGDIGLVRISGVTGVLVSLGQRLIGSSSYFTHAFVVVGDGMVVQAQPGGAECVPLAEAVGSRRVVYTDFALDHKRGLISLAAVAMVGTPYSFLDYAAIGLRRILRFAGLERYVANTGHLICSQLADLAYKRAGFELFPGRIPGDVTPGDIARLIGAK